MVVSLHQAALSSAPGWLRQGECRSAEWPPKSSQTKRESNVKEQSCDTYILQLQDKHLQWDFRRYLAMPTLSGRVLKSVRTISLEPNLEALKRRMMSWRVAATTKYSCFNLSSLPSKNYKKTGTKSIRQVCKNHVMSLKEYIYIYAFSRCFYPKRLTVHSGYTFFVCVCSLGIEPTTFCAPNAMLYHWARKSLKAYVFKHCMSSQQHIFAVWLLKCSGW